ncbi:MAG: hypothetical protein JXA30_16790 [Deltaproteobacteria bacterium]|nr:hypothetical protein [Deltaproteobacteria bacterium]
MDSSIYIIHSSSDAERAKRLIEYLQASSAGPLRVQSSSVPEYSVDAEAESSEEIKSALYQVDKVIAEVTNAALTDPEFNFELGVAWALNDQLITLVDAEVTNGNLPQMLNRVTQIAANGPESLIELAKKVLPNYIESEAGTAALATFLEAGVEHEAQTASGEDRQKTGAVDTLQGIPAVLPDAALQDRGETDTYPFFLEALNAGLTFSDCFFYREEISDFCRELDETFGSFVNSLGGNWAGLRRLNDIDIWSNAMVNLFETLPQEQQGIADWYDLGFHLSTMLNIAGRDTFANPEQKEMVKAQWDNAMDAFRYSAAAADISPENIDRIQSMLENLIGAAANRDFSNVAKSLELMRNLAKSSLIWDQRQHQAL